MDLEALQTKYGTVGAVEYNGHTVVFRKPTREQARDYRRKRDSDTEKVDAMDQLAQVTIVAFDEELDPTRARIEFTTKFLEDFPLAMSNPKFANCLSVLAGVMEAEEEKDLGKGVTIKGPHRTPSPTG